MTLRQCHTSSWLSDLAAWRLFRFRIIRAVVGTTASVRYFVIHSCPRSIGTSISRARHPKRGHKNAGLLFRFSYYRSVIFCFARIHRGIISLVDPGMHRASFSVNYLEKRRNSVCVQSARPCALRPSWFPVFLCFFLSARSLGPLTRSELTRVSA